MSQSVGTVSRNRSALVIVAATASLLFLPEPTIAQSAKAFSASAIPAGADDPMFQKPYVDVEEWRDAPVRHLYVHGGFAGTDTRFSFYFPERRAYQRRFFQHITPVPASETLAQREPVGPDNKIAFALASGAYFVETNGGGAKNVAGPDFSITAYRANAASADYSRKVAGRLFGTHRPHGYAYGGSGGAYRTIGGIENTHGVWDGVVPYVPGSTMALPNVFSARLHAMRVLWNKFPGIVGAMDAGGSGDPYAGLTGEERAALLEVTRMGFPPASWFDWKTMGVHGFAAVYPIIKMVDRSYFTDFWTKPGYLGFDAPDSFGKWRIRQDSMITAVVTAREAAAAGLDVRRPVGDVDDSFLGSGADPERVVALRLSPAIPADHFLGGDLTMIDGRAKNRSLQIARIVGNIAVLGPADAELLQQFRPGEHVRLDTSDFLAAQTYHRHQVPGRDFPVWNQFRKADGSPIYPQRPMLLGPLITRTTVGSDMTGEVHGKVILVSSLWDREAFPWQADWYAKRVRQKLGARFGDSFRLWYTDRGLHGDGGLRDGNTLVVRYVPILQQALLDLSAWAERGIAPPRSTSYAITDGQVTVPATAAARGGIQPVVTLAVDGHPMRKVRAGQQFVLAASAATPDGAGRIVDVRFDLDGSGVFAIVPSLKRKGTGVSTTLRHRYHRPGTYFITVRATSSRSAENGPFAKIDNLARVRVEVN